MIKLDLGEEPAALTKQRQVNLSLAIASFNQVGVGAKEFKEILDGGYQVARTALVSRQYKKCAFCEKKMDEIYMPVEHFRPKKGAQNKVGSTWITVDTHYWWFAWTWSNLYFACAECNVNGRKGSRFPIRRGTTRIDALTAPAPDPIPDQHYDVTSEQNLLLDPRTDNPFEHLEWNPVDRKLPKIDWTWTISARDDRGDMTIDVLELKRREDEVNDHLRLLKVIWKQIDLHLNANRFIEARHAWKDAISAYVDDPEQPYRNAAWCALNTLCDATERMMHGFATPVQPVVTYVPPPTALPLLPVP